jgi:hypothetical protein
MREFNKLQLFVHKYTMINIHHNFSEFHSHRTIFMTIMIFSSSLHFFTFWKFHAMLLLCVWWCLFSLVSFHLWTNKKSELKWLKSGEQWSPLKFIFFGPILMITIKQKKNSSSLCLISFSFVYAIISPANCHFTFSSLHFYKKSKMLVGVESNAINCVNNRLMKIKSVSWLDCIWIKLIFAIKFQ